MRIQLCLSLGLLSLSFSTQAQFDRPNQPAGGRVERIEYPAQIVSRGLHHKTWQRFVDETLPDGRVNRTAVGYVELALGMHVAKEGRLEEVSEVIELFERGAVARGQHEVRFAPNLNTPGAIDVLMPDGRRFRSHVLGLGIFDFATGRSLLLAACRDSVGQLHAPNRVVYPSAFDSIEADVRYTFRRDGLSQDVLIKQLIEIPDGFNEASSVVEIWSEIVEAPEPIKRTQLKTGVPDEALDFGPMKISSGKAFPVGDGPAQRAFPVFKRWLAIDGRRFLVEAVQVSVVNAELVRLGIQQAAVLGPRAGQAALINPNARPFPAAPAAPQRRAQVNQDTIQLASLAPPPRGFLADYELLLTQTVESLTLQGDWTYHLSGNVTVTNLIIEGNSVLKSSAGVSLHVVPGGSVECRTDPYRPAVFTSKDDNSIGATITGSTGQPEPYWFGYPFLHLVEDSQLAHVRFAYGNPAIYYDFDSGDHDLRHAQFVHCPTGIWIEDASTFYLGNVLMSTPSTTLRPG